MFLVEFYFSFKDRHESKGSFLVEGQRDNLNANRKPCRFLSDTSELFGKHIFISTFVVLFVLSDTSDGY